MKFNFWTHCCKSKVYCCPWEFSRTPSCKTNDKDIKSWTGGFANSDEQLMPKGMS